MAQIVDILRSESRTLVEEFTLAAAQGKGTAQEIADFREHAVQSFVRRFYPSSYVVSKGKVTDLDGNQSNSIDCLVLNPEHPHLIDSGGKFRLIFADGCDAAVEVKPGLNRLDELHRGLAQGVSVKKIKRSKSPLLMASQKPDHIIQHSLYVPFFLFAVEAFDSQTLYEHVVKYYKDNAIPPELQLDGICVLNEGMLRHFTHSAFNPYGTSHAAGGKAGWCHEKWEDLSLLGFLLALDMAYGSVPRMTASVIGRVLRRASGTIMLRYVGDGA
jgi:hypothetical protein